MFSMRSVFIFLLPFTLFFQTYGMEDRNADLAVMLEKIERDTQLCNQKNGYDITPLMYCICNVPLHRYISFFMSDINEQSDQGFTALMLAVKVGDQGLVSALLEQGADLSLKDSAGHRALY